MSGYTRISQNLWVWQPFVSLKPDASRLWLMLYTSSPGRRVPGLWTGSIATMAATAKMGYQDTIAALRELLDQDMVEYDPHHEVLRMTQFPDAGEYPTAPNILMAWWHRFNEIVACDVRDRHVDTLRWLLEQGARESSRNRSKQVSQKHEEIWGETFALVTKPGQTAPVVLFSSDTSTPSQPGLFAPRTLPVTLPVTAPLSSQPPDPEWSDSGMSGPFRKGGEKEKENSLSGSPVPGSGSGSGDPDPESAPRAAPPPGPEPPGKVIPFPKTPDALRALVASFAPRVNEARVRVAEGLGIRDFRPVAIMGGEQTLLERLRESTDPGGDLDYTLRMAELEALAKRSIRWLGWSIAEPKSWRALLAATAEEIQRAGPDARGAPERSIFDVVAETCRQMEEDPSL